MEIHLVDGTYELFRHYYAVPRARDADGREVGAVRGVLASVLAMINGGATHVGVATDHVIESFRNRLWPGYKTGDGIEPDLWAQFPLLEEALTALGVAVWPMVEFEADDALAAAARSRRRSASRSRADLHARQGPGAVRARHPGGAVHRAARGRSATKPASSQSSACAPASIPDYLALVGDAADGYPGLPGWGANPRQPSSPSSAISRRFPPTERRGA